MKFERLNENQIRCTLNRADLADRELRIHELAYGTDKAKALFQEMMQQASYEVGFEAENIPLMIEAIPVSPDCLVLIITKVEDPEELDIRFSKFTKPHSLDLPDGDDEPYPEEEEDITTIYDKSQDEEPIPFHSNGTIADALDFLAPFTNAIQQAKEAAEKAKDKNSESQEVQRFFLFQNLKTIMEIAPKVSGIYKEENSLYKDSLNNKYYLSLTKGKLDAATFQQVCNLLSEYGQRSSYTYASTSYFKEHFETIIEKKAMKVLAGL